VLASPGLWACTNCGFRGDLAATVEHVVRCQFEVIGSFRLGWNWWRDIPRKEERLDAA
jgi:hypothetical protein